MTGGLSDDGFYVQPEPMVPFDLGPWREEPDDYYEDDETGPRPRFPVPAYAGGGESTKSNTYDDIDFNAYAAAQREWVRAAQEANREGKRWPPCPDSADYRTNA